MSKENIEKLMEVIRENRELIIEMSKGCYKNTMDGDCFQGWNVGVIADIDGDINDYYWSQGTSNTAIYHGEAIRVVNYTTGSNVPEYEMQEFMLGDRKEEFIQFLIDNEYLDEDDKEDWEAELTWGNVNEFDSNITTEYDNDSINWDVDEFYEEAADQQIDQTLADLQMQLDWEEGEE